MKIGDIVLWEDWAGPQKIESIYCLDNNSKGLQDAKVFILENAPKGAVVFVDLVPMIDSGGVEIGHAVPFDSIVPFFEEL